MQVSCCPAYTVPSWFGPTQDALTNGGGGAAGGGVIPPPPPPPEPEPLTTAPGPPVVTGGKLQPKTSQTLAECRTWVPEIADIGIWKDSLPII
ncbi:MAG: hypothetical protein E6J20_20670 [Chloroflexi bacterium]|nr:MAG: hypothetical protein E6J20_20670 [Chloroflexota bacterium]